MKSLDQIADWPLILGGPTTHSRRLVDEELRRRGLSYRVVVELDSMDMRKRYVSLGMGIAVGASHAIDPADEEEVGIISLATLFPVEQIGIVTLRGKLLPTPAQNFVSLMRSTVVPRTHGGRNRQRR